MTRTTDPTRPNAPTLLMGRWCRPLRCRAPRLGPAWAGGALLLALLAGGCSNMRSIDQAVDRLVVARSERIGAGDTGRRLRQPYSDATDRPGQADKRPQSANPTREELAYKTIAPDNDVLARLETYGVLPSDARMMDLEGAFRQAHETSREFINAEEEYILACIRLLIEQHRWGPRFFDDVTTSIVSPPSTGERQAAINVVNDLRATQRLPYGGEVQAQLIARAADQLAGIVGERYTQSTQLALSANIPLLRNAGLIAQEDLIQAERDVIYAARQFEQFRREFLVSIARDYFSLTALQSSIKNQEERLKSVTNFQEQQQALVEAGRTAAFELRNVEQDLLSARNSLVNSQEVYIVALERFKIRLGVPVEAPIVLQPVTLDIPAPDISIVDSTAVALDYRLDYQTQRDRVDDARRRVANSRNQLLPNLDVNVRTAFNTSPADPQGGLSFDLDQTDSSASVTFGLPLDREEERLNLRSATIALERQIRELSLQRDTVVLDARRAVREIDRARLSVRLQEESVEINELRLEEVRLKADIIDAQKRLDAENNLLQARNDRDVAVRDLRVAILEYLQTTGQLRVTRDGQFLPLPGMNLSDTPPVDPALDSPAAATPENPVAPEADPPPAEP